MIGALLFVLLAGQSPAAAAPANAEDQIRKALVARGMSPAGIAATFAINHRHEQALRVAVEHGRAAEAGVRAALAKRPVDVDGFAAAMTARTEATMALQRETSQMMVEQMRALSPTDRLVLTKGSPAPPR